MDEIRCIMMLTVCPNCGQSKLIEMGDGVYQCTSCGYTGHISGKSILQS